MNLLTKNLDLFSELYGLESLIWIGNPGDLPLKTWNQNHVTWPTSRWHLISLQYDVMKQFQESFGITCHRWNFEDCFSMKIVLFSAFVMWKWSKIYSSIMRRQRWYSLFCLFASFRVVLIFKFLWNQVSLSLGLPTIWGCLVVKLTVIGLCFAILKLISSMNRSEASAYVNSNGMSLEY